MVERRGDVVGGHGRVLLVPARVGVELAHGRRLPRMHRGGAAARDGELHVVALVRVTARVRVGARVGPGLGLGLGLGFGFGFGLGLGLGLGLGPGLGLGQGLELGLG